jgi:hypothetical protein
MSGRERDEGDGNVTLAIFAGVTIVAYLAACGLLYLIFKAIH